jgi:3-methyladenine DNA glycosylase AlkC
MAAALKDIFSEKLVREIASEINSVEAGFDTRRFIENSLKTLDNLTLTGRAWQLADAMWQHLPKPFSRAASVLIASLGPEHASTEEFGLAPLRYMPHVFLVQKYGLDDFESAMQVQYELTKRFSAEFSIRSFLLKYPDATYARLVKWAGDPNAHVRRLVSEGTRPRLPWAPRLPVYQENPDPVLKLLELLKDDPVRYVQRSIANNLNDISKDHPGLVVETCARWLERKPAPGRKWIVGHALRSLIKQGNRAALKILGAGTRPQVKIRNVRISPGSVRIGSELNFSFTLESSSARKQDLLVDYIIHFAKAKGALRPKVFKLKRINIDPREAVGLGAKVSFAPMTNRKPYAGRHRIEILVNGVVYGLGEFLVK